MADVPFNRALGSAAEWAVIDPTKFGVLLLKASQADSAIRIHNTIDAMLGDAGNTEADATNYARKTGITVTRDQDNVGHEVSLSIPEQTWETLGGGTNNSIVKLVIYWEDPAAGAPDDTDRFPVGAFDLVFTTDGSTVLVEPHEDGFWISS